MKRNDNRKGVLEEINRVFEKYELPRWNKLKCVGRHSDNECEITGVMSVWDDAYQYFIIIQFSIIYSDGSNGVYSMRFERPGAVVLLIVNGKVVLVRQHRLCTCGWTIECMRGWLPVSPDWVHENNYTPADMILRSELGGDFVSSLSILHHHRFQPIYQDTGTRASSIEMHVVIAESEKPVPKKNDHLELISKWGWKEFLTRWDESDSLGKRLCPDLHSQAIILKAERLFRAKPELARLFT